MRLTYDATTDSLYVSLREGTAASSDEIAPNVVADLDDEGNLTGLDIQHASTTVDLGDLHLEGLTDAGRGTSV